jgi:hypothetical protein
VETPESELFSMPYKAIKEAEKAFRTAIYGRAAQFDMDTIQRAESLLLQSRAVADSDPVKSRALAENARQIALDAIAKTETEKQRLKKTLNSDVASLIQEYSRTKMALGDIKKRIDKPTYLRISQRLEIAEVCMKKAKEGLDNEQFNSFPVLFARSRKRLTDVEQILTPVLEQLSYPESSKG